MRQIHLTAKQKGLPQEKLDALQSDKYARLDAEELKGSTGVYAKDYEPNVRHQLAKHGLTERDFHARTNGSNSHYVEDGVIFINGVRLRYEVKTGDGIVGYIKPTRNPEFDENDILPGIDLVIYACEVKEMQDEDDILDNSVVLTRSEFLTFLAVNGPKRSRTVATATKFGTNDKFWRDKNRAYNEFVKNHPYTELPFLPPWKDCIVLQPTYRDARQKACLSGDYTSLRTFLEENGRA